jgi:SOS-response transcriptional repressor LexA
MWNENGEDRRKIVRQFVFEYWEEHKAPPTIREIMEGIGNNSTSHVAHVLRKLAEQGYIVLQPGQSRGAIPLEAFDLHLRGVA